MHKTKLEALNFVDTLNTLLPKELAVDICITPSFPLIRPVADIIRVNKQAIVVGAQDVSSHDEGAFTGEVCSKQLIDAGAALVLVAHSERRLHHHETNVIAHQKIRACLQVGLTPLYCVGETQEERAAGNTISVITEQINEACEKFTPEEKKRISIAYEPRWAIGSGQVSSAEDIAETHACIRKLLGSDARIVYGGSVNAENAREILAIPNVNGLLVGSKSLDPQSFASIIQSAIYIR